MKLPQKSSFGPETCEIEPKVGNMGPYGPRMGPAQALEEREKFRKKTFFLRNIFFLKNIVFDIHIAIFISF